MTTRDLGKLWLLLSAGVTYDELMVQNEIAAKAGAAGFIAGRVVWDAAAAEEALDGCPAGGYSCWRKIYEGSLR